MIKRYYLAYGSNLSLEQMKKRCPNAKKIGIFDLNDYRLVYKGREDEYAYLTIEPDKGSFVPLGLFELSLADIHSLDYYEVFPNSYSKKYLPFIINNKVKKAFIYVMNEEFDYHLPSINYLNKCIEGYNDFGFDKSILKKALSDTMNNISKKMKKR